MYIIYSVTCHLRMRICASQQFLLLTIRLRLHIQLWNFITTITFQKMFEDFNNV
jgi:hypothetical protein